MAPFEKWRMPRRQLLTLTLVFPLAVLCVRSVHADELSTVTIIAVDPAASEAGPKAATIFVARNDGDLAKPLVVALQISGTATAGADYVPVSSSITFAPNVPLVTIKVMPIKDTIKEGEETVILTLVPSPRSYRLGDDKSATATIADAGGGSEPGTPTSGDTPSPPGVNERSGTLGVTLTFDGAGTWKHPQNGAYSNLKFHRELSYAIPLRVTVGAGAGVAEIDRKYPIDPVNVNFKRYLAGHPRDATAAAGTPCGTGTVTILDESSGMEVGDPGQAPLVPFTPVPADALAVEGSKVIVDASTMSGPMSSTFPLTATVRWKLRIE